jgi:hypothetical protein
MATREPQTSGQNRKKPAARRQAGQGRVPAQGAAERDDTYGLISVIYHSLQGAETCTQYIADARRTGNDDLAGFFEECRDEQNRRALLGRRLLADELADVEQEVDELVEDDDENA